MNARSNFIWILTFWLFSAAAQTTQNDEQFSYHRYFCKGDSTPNLRKQEKLFRQSKQDATVLWAMRLSHAGLISYNDTFTRHMQFTADMLQPSYPVFKIKIATIKSSEAGFLSVSKDLIYIYSGSYARLETDEQLKGLLILAVVNHQRFYGKAKPNVYTSGNRWMLFNEVTETDYRHASLLLRQIYPNSGWGIPVLHSAFMQQHFDLKTENYFKHNTSVQTDYNLRTIGQLTTATLLFQDGSYDKAIRMLLDETTVHNRFTAHLLFKCFYMKTLEMVQHPYFPKEQFHFFKHGKEPISDPTYFKNLLYWMQEGASILSSDTARSILYQTILLEQDYADLPQNKYNYILTGTSEIFIKKLKLDSGWGTFTTSIHKYPWYQNVEKIYKDSIPSARFLELLPDPTGLKKGHVLLIIGEPTLQDTFTITIRNSQWGKKERFTEYRLMQKIRLCTDQLIHKSRLPATYQNDYKILRHGDLCRHTTEISEAGLQSPFVSWLTRDYDPEFNSRNIHYIIYLQTSMLPGSRFTRIKQLLIQQGLPIQLIYNKFLSGIDVYDVLGRKYIFTSRRLIDYHGMDLFIANLFDQLSPIIK